MTIHERIHSQSAAGRLSRRGFLTGAGAAAGAFSFGFSFPLPVRAVAQEAAKETVKEVNAWVVIQPDESVIIRIARAEMGQGSLTGLAQLVAEELDCDWDKVRFELVKPGENRRRERVWRDQSTGGSRAIRGSQEYVRMGGATARAMLVQAAAQQWGVPAARCSVAKGVITHQASGRSTTYGAVAAAANGIAPPTGLTLKDPKDWTIAGQPVKRLDTLDKLNGSLVYGMDISMPGMLVAIPKACPVHGGKLKSFDASAVSNMRGVKHVLRVDDETVAVVADTFWRAKTALDALPIEWDNGPNANVSSETIAAMLREGLTADTQFVGNRVGDAKAVLAGAGRVIEADYGFPYQNHAPMEVINATVRWTPERCEMWGPTQVAEAALDALAAAAELPAEACEVHVVRIGGSFGRRLTTEYVTMATRIARQVPGTPVKMMWTREEDMAQGRYHPVTQCRLRGAVDADGNLEALHMRISGQSIMAYMRPSIMTANGDPVTFQGLMPGGAEMAIGYTIPDLLIDHAMRNPHIRPGAWRGVNLNQNAVYLECFIDELAQAAKVDPLAFRRKLMANHPKHLAVLEAAAKGIGWETTKPPEGVHRGLAQVMGFGSYVAAAAEVSVKDGRLKIHRIVAATDPGYVVNPQQVEAQIAGSFVYGLSAMLYGECTVKDGRIVEENFDTYNVMRLDEMPVVEVITVPSGGFWGGVGEPTIAVAAPAVLNAVFAATGKRVRQLPLKNIDLNLS
ncbi:xanthine dehydrogenase family protein molybdopterin-binding subunit [Ancylobacter sonchi]|uniref:xanthine dehydrogenase family protein molybdopterin-binding subunit n=1 Tax=Ancylobacter sonchi TaxID=1937790 RepID=UPI001BD2894E|nr:molybdopterin cofactor-binding domain-containing protein [Ancylobacter sonchi]MBS7534573.1 xanthine dehydrogenase family protein molybdopterin-binding subunit [Ancylobacter sonchi]